MFGAENNQNEDFCLCKAIEENRGQKNPELNFNSGFKSVIRKSYYL